MTAYQVIARKWRPQSFHDLVGQEHISTTLLNALRGNRLPQAILFTGVRGTGKTSSARILAKSLRCTNSKDYVPCGKCGECEDIANSRSLDVIEIDGASNNGVDAIRELRETVGYMPSSGKYKIYIIDEVHMLSTSAFNALLKTLEEPPAHVIFIMATTEAQKIPNTILSRCQRFDFRRIPSRLIADWLKKICDAEKVKTETEALWLIARQADGSMRDSQSLLDQVITFSASDVTLAKTIDVLGLTDRSLLLETLQALMTRDVQKAVDVIEKVFKAGYDPKVFAQDLLEEFRHALMVRLVPDSPGRLVDLPDVEIQHLRDLTAPLGEEDLHLLFDMCLKGVNDLLRAQDARIVLEMLLLRMAAAPRIASLAALANGTAVVAQSPSANQQRTVAASTPPRANSPTALPGEPAQTASAPGTVRVPQYTMESFTKPAPGAVKKPAPTQSSATSPNGNVIGNTGGGPKSSQTTQVTDPHDDAPQASDPARAGDPWYKFVESVKKSNSLLGAMLENTHLIQQDGFKLQIGVPKKMSFMLDKVKESENLKRIEGFLETLWNGKFKVEVLLADESGEKTTPKAAAEKRQAQKERSIEDAVEQDPLIKSAQNVFKTQIKSIKDVAKRE